MPTIIEIASDLFYSVENTTREVEMAYVITIAIFAWAFKWEKNSNNNYCCTSEFSVVLPSAIIQ